AGELLVGPQDAHHGLERPLARLLALGLVEVLQLARGHPVEDALRLLAREAQVLGVPLEEGGLAVVELAVDERGQRQVLEVELGLHDILPARAGTGRFYGKPGRQSGSPGAGAYRGEVRVLAPRRMRPAS